MLLRREFTFDAAHNLVSYHGKCEKLHGHTYRMMVELSGAPDSEGMIADFASVKEIVDGEVLSKFDHGYLNEIIPQPTAENIARYVFERLDAPLAGPNRSLNAVQVWETANSSVVFSRGDFEEIKSAKPAARAALFDFDLTLMDTSYAITDCTNMLADEFGLKRVTRDEMIKLIGLPILDSWIALWGESRPEWLDFYRGELRAKEHSGFREFPDTRNALGRLRANGVLTGVVSNRNKARGAVEECGLAPLFDVIIGAEDVSSHKPHPDPLLKAMSLLGVEPGAAFYTGDTDIDMKTARSAGVRGIGVTTGAFGAEELISAGAEITCANLDGAADFILKEIER